MKSILTKVSSIIILGGMLISCGEDIITTEDISKIKEREPSVKLLDEAYEVWEVSLLIKEGMAWLSTLIKVSDNSLQTAVIVESPQGFSIVKPELRLKVGKQMRAYKSASDNTFVQLNTNNHGYFNKFIIPINDLREAIKTSRDSYIHFDYYGNRGKLPAERLEHYLFKVEEIRSDKILGDKTTNNIIPLINDNNISSEAELPVDN